MKSLILLILCGCLIACGSEKTKDIELNRYKGSFFAKKCYTKEVLIWYKTNGQLNADGAALMADIDQAHHLGLFPEVYQQLRNQLSYGNAHWSLKDRDLMLSEVACLFFSHLKYGMLDEVGNVKGVELTTLDINPLSQLQHKGYFHVFNLFNADNPLYLALVKAKKTPFFESGDFHDFKIDLSYQEYKSHKDSIYSYLEQSVLRHDYIQEGDFKTYIAQYQKHHNLTVDSLLGKYSLPLMAKSNLDRFIAYVFTLNELRKEQFNEELQLIVNIPAFKAQMWKEGRIDREHKVIVGTSENQTPELDAQIAYVETFPFWNVPFSISSKELLHHIQKDTNYIARNNFEVLDHKSKKIHHDSVDWKSLTPNSLPYVLRQKGGDDNALGYVKIIFPNEHAVYLHDTPGRHLFNKDVRTFSHGCMRLHQPVEFASYLLEMMNENAPDLDSLIALKKNMILPLREKIDIAVRYYLVGLGQEGHLEWYSDCYQKKQEDLNHIKSVYYKLQNNSLSKGHSASAKLLSYN